MDYYKETFQFMERTEGVYTYLCPDCDSLFAIVSRFTVKSDRIESVKCPKCLSVSSIYGEGSVNYTLYNSHKPESSETSAKKEDVYTEGYPAVLTAKEVAEILGVSRRIAYEIMERSDFPLIRIGRHKKVKRDNFFEWLNQQEKE
jgi:excisionase family DNA binding protein